MYNLLRYYRQNKKKIWTIVGFIALLIISIQILDKLAISENNKKIRMEDSGNSIQNTISTEKAIPIISEGKISNTQVEENTNLIDTFVEYCNSKKIKEAYNLLTKECKETNYPTIQNFVKNYYNKIFTDARTCNMELWIAEYDWYTYRITYMGDIMSSGKIDNSNTINDYITIVKTENGESKLNINSYVGRKEINKESKSDGIEIKVISKDVFMDHETYNFEIKNMTNKVILLNNRKDSNTICLEDNSNVKYSSRIYEIDNNLLVFGSNFSRKLSIKFNKVYGTQRNIEGVNFTNIIMDYEKYLKESNVENFKETGNVFINL